MQKHRFELNKENEKNDTEESLHLSVYTSDLTKNKPVMVWIHGGGWSVGAASEYWFVPFKFFNIFVNT